MTFPIEISIGGYNISLHLLFETFAFIIGFRYYLYLRKKSTDKISDNNRLWIILGAIIGALLFSRLVGALEKPIEWLDSTNPLFYLYANKTLVGGLLGGLLGVEVIKKVIHEKSSSGDLFVFPILLAIIIGRMGCFTMGIYEETYGTPSALPWAMDLGDGIPRHPVALYEIVFCISLWLVLWKIRKNKTLKNGDLFKFLMIGYLIFRFLLDFIKPGDRYLCGLGTIQIVCLVGLFYYRKSIIHYWKIFFKTKNV